MRVVKMDGEEDWFFANAGRLDEEKNASRTKLKELRLSEKTRGTNPELSELQLMIHKKQFLVSV